MKTFQSDIGSISRSSKILLGIGIVVAFLDAGLRFVTPVPINVFSPVAYTIIVLLILENQYEIRKLRNKVDPVDGE